MCRFVEKVARGTVHVDWGYQGETNNHITAQYDLSRPETEGLLRNLCAGIVEPFEAWKERDTRWKGAI